MASGYIWHERSSAQTLQGLSLVLFRPVSTFRTEPVTAGVGGREHKPFGGFLNENQFLQISSQVNPIQKTQPLLPGSERNTEGAVSFALLKSDDENKRKTKRLNLAAAAVTQFQGTG